MEELWITMIWRKYFCLNQHIRDDDVVDPSFTCMPLINITDCF